MKRYNLLPTNNGMQFSGKGLPVMFFVLLSQLSITVEFTGKKIHPYTVNISESEFMSCIEMASEL